jgi:hypothetical protein
VGCILFFYFCWKNEVNKQPQIELGNKLGRIWQQNGGHLTKHGATLWAKTKPGNNCEPANET